MRVYYIPGFPCGLAGKESAWNVGDLGSIPGLGRSPGEGKGYPLQYSWASFVAQLVKTLPAMWEIWIQSLGCKDPPEKGKATHTVFWPGEFHGLYPRGRRESHRTEQLSLSQSLDPFLIQSLWYRPDVHKWSSTILVSVIPGVSCSVSPSVSSSLPIPTLWFTQIKNRKNDCHLCLPSGCFSVEWCDFRKVCFSSESFEGLKSHRMDMECKIEIRP